MNQRITNLRTKMKVQDLKAVLINNLKNVYYLTGFWGSNGTVLVTEERVVLFTDSRYTIHAHATCFPFVEIVETRNELEEAAKIACANEFIEKKQSGFFDPIAQGGTNLSGGQRQRMAIARAIMKKPEFMF